MSKDPKVLIIWPDVKGGMQTVINLYCESEILKNKILTLSSYKDGSIMSNLIFFGKFLVKYINSLLKYRSIKIVHIHTASKGSFLRKSISAIIAKLFNKKVILHIHSGEFLSFYNKSPRFLKRYIKGVLDKCDVVITLNNNLNTSISKKCSNNNIQVLYNPTILKYIPVRKSNITKVLFLGLMGKNKGVYDIIEAARYIQSDSIQFHLYGNGEVLKVRELVNEYNLKNKVIVHGWISGNDKEKILQESDIFILPSYSEGLPMSILEAISYGLPVISTPVGGIPDAVKDGVNGFLISPGDYKALAQKINAIANDKELSKQMGNESYRIAREKFDINVIINQLDSLYNAVAL